MFGEIRVFVALHLACFLLGLCVCREVCTLGRHGFDDVASKTILASVVFEGKVLQLVELSYSPDGFSSVSKIHGAEFEVESTLKGDLSGEPTRVVVVAEPGCKVPLKAKQKYIVFLNSTSDVVDGNEVLWMSGAPQKHTKKAASDVRSFSCRGCGQKPVAKLSPKKLLTKKGSDVTLKCQIGGRPIPKITWFKDDEPLKNSVRLVVKSLKTQSTLTIKGAVAEDAAKYWCQAENVLGRSSSSKTPLLIQKEVPPNLSDELLERCSKHEYCFNGGTCQVRFDGERFCVCASGFTGPRCQDRYSESEYSKIDDRESNVDKALASSILLILLLILATLVALLYCTVRSRQSSDSRLQNLDDKLSSERNLFFGHDSGEQVLQSIQIDRVNGEKLRQAVTPRKRLSAVSSILDADPDLKSLRSCYEEVDRVKNNKQSGRGSITRSDRVLLMTDDEIDGPEYRSSEKRKSVDETSLARCHPFVGSRHGGKTGETSTLSPGRFSNCKNKRHQTSRDGKAKLPGDGIDTNVTETRCLSKDSSHELPSHMLFVDNNREAAEEVNNLLRELGVYDPESGNELPNDKFNVPSLSVNNAVQGQNL